MDRSQVDLDQGHVRGQPIARGDHAVPDRVALELQPEGLGVAAVADEPAGAAVGVRQAVFPQTDTARRHTEALYTAPGTP